MLYLVPTPIGNLEDLTFRALRILKEADLILAEDTRKTGILLKHYEVQTPMQSYHIHNEHRLVEGLAERINQLEEGHHIALVSDAGTPAISDPGFLLVRACAEADVRVECLPGATSIVPALVQAGLPSDRFCFEGFLPHKKGRQTRIKALAEEERTLVFLESPHRICKTLGQLADFFGEDRPAVLCRELTKIHEETLRGTLASLLAAQPEKPKGEMVLVVSGKGKEAGK